VATDSSADALEVAWSNAAAAVPGTGLLYWAALGAGPEGSGSMWWCRIRPTADSEATSPAGGEGVGACGALLAGETVRPCCAASCRALWPAGTRRAAGPGDRGNAGPAVLADRGGEAWGAPG
jgi:hypothetical protein